MTRKTFRTSVIPLAALLGWAAPAMAQNGGDPAKGLAYAKQVCAECHALEGKVPMPGQPAAPFAVIANSPGMTGTAMEVWFRSPHVNMPNLIIPEADRANVIAYITSLRDKR